MARLAATRRRLGLTLVEFAKVAGLADGTLTRWLNGSRQPHPSARPPVPAASPGAFTELTRWRRTVPEGIEPASFGERVRALHIRRGWTQRELGERVGVHAAMVPEWESGSRTPATAQQKILLSELHEGR